MPAAPARLGLRFFARRGGCSSGSYGKLQGVFTLGVFISIREISYRGRMVVHGAERRNQTKLKAKGILPAALFEEGCVQDLRNTHGQVSETL